MANVRAGWQGDYALGKHEFYAVYHFALQYSEWADRYQALGAQLKAQRYDTDKVQSSPTQSSTVEDPAIERAELDGKMKIVEQAAQQADGDLSKYILKAATTEGITYNYLQQVMMIPCGRDTYYKLRHKFYWLLSKKIKISNQGT